MVIRQEKFTVTFYDEDEVLLAEKFKQILKDKNKSINQTLKELVNEYTKNNS